MKDLINYLLNTDITKLAKKDLEKLKNNVSHYIQLITDFLSSNTNADQNWKNLLKCLGYIDQILKKSNLSNLQQTYKEVKKTLSELKNSEHPLDTKEIYDYLKFTITKLGGFSALLHRFQNRIKCDMIQSIANDDKDYRKIDTSITNQKG